MDCSENLEHSQPIVSVVLAVRNEALHVEQAMRSLLDQRHDGFELEILVIDGMSTDETPYIVRRAAANDPRIRLLTNPRRKAQHAFNIGLQSARGEYLCIFGSHAAYDADYITVCIEELHRHDAVGVSGQLVTSPASDTVHARLIAWALAHPFGSSGSSVRTKKDGYVDTIPFPVFRRAALLKLGGYDEQLDRNQDNDMNQRLRSAGHKLFLTSRTKARYFVKPDMIGMARHAFLTGYWNLLSLRRKPASMSLRHFVPFTFVGGVVLSALFALLVHATWSFWPLLAILLAHFAAGTCAALQVGARERSGWALVLPIVFITFHFAYGLGTAWAVLKNDRLESPRTATAS
jgi:succinoglycan biosynthesis protein ExoA